MMKIRITALALVAVLLCAPAVAAAPLADHHADDEVQRAGLLTEVVEYFQGLLEGFFGQTPPPNQAQPDSEDEGDTGGHLDPHG